MPSKRFKKLPENTNTLNLRVLINYYLLVKQNCTTKFDESIRFKFSN